MKIISNGDTYADALSTATFATIPFITIGAMDHPAVLWISSALGILFASLFLIRFIMIIHDDSCVRTSKRLENLMSMMQFPYVSALAGMILIDKGLEAQPVMWLSLAIAVGTVAFILLESEEHLP
ncbi:MAG: hypothetical protein K2J58_00175 [Muribaculaceae bacterium]|nr:hypothetical protein [Muribaculaceae bacterium]